MPIRRGSNISVAHPGVPGGTDKTTSHAFQSCFNHLGVRSRGTTKMWVENWRLILAVRSCSKATSAAAGGGAQTNTPLRRIGLEKSSPSWGCVQPRISCPNSYQPSGLRTSRFVRKAQEEIQGRRSDDRSSAERCSGMNERISSPAITPSFKSPRDTPSPPSAIIRVPAT
jgi:hypothetical protein